MAFKVLLALVSLIALQTALAAPLLDCSNIDAETCKTQFGKQYETEFKTLYRTAMHNLFTKYVEIAEKVKSELPADDEYAKIFENAIKEMKALLAECEASKDDDKKMVEIVEKGMRTMELDLHDDTPATENCKKLLKKYEFKEALYAVMHKFAIDIGKLWSEMYAGLPTAVSKEFPELAAVNENMQKLQEDHNSPVKLQQYEEVRDIFSEKFKLPFFEVLTTIA